MFRKLLKRDFYIHKPVLLIMPVPKFGKINLMTTNLMYGHLDVFFMKWRLSNLHSMLMTWKVYIRKLSKVIVQESPLIFHKIYQILSDVCYRWRQHLDQIAVKYFQLKIIHFYTKDKILRFPAVLKRLNDHLL